MLRHACRFALANKGHETRALQVYLDQLYRTIAGSVQGFLVMVARGSTRLLEPTRSGFRLDPIGGIMGHARPPARNHLCPDAQRRCDMAFNTGQSPLRLDLELSALYERARRDD